MAGVRVKSKQCSFQFRTHGGKRRGAGRKRVAEKPRVQHRPRVTLDGRTPVHVTVRMRTEIKRLRRRDQFRVLRRVFARTGNREAFRICHFSIQANHIHLLCEASNERALSRGMNSFGTSCARRLNQLVGRRGAVFDDRYHSRRLRTPAEVRHALCYCLNNWRRHHEDRGAIARVDHFSSAAFFDGWAGFEPEPPPWLRDGEPPPVARPRTWLLSTGWRRHGAIGPSEVPG
jgi:REP element-mobilizing transposase RayT